MWAIGIHGGAGFVRGTAPERQTEVLETTLAWAVTELAQDAPALDVVEGTVRLLEDSGQFVAGKGSHPNTDGAWELDASICDGATRRCGAVAALTGVYPPISIARAVMERTERVLLVGDGARRFALEQGFAMIDIPSKFFVTAGPRDDTALGSLHGTVGAVALDLKGNIAAATSTGGTFGKPPGRVGDSPIVGAGTWADASIGVSCTGIGEYFVRTAAAHKVAMLHELAGDALDGAVHSVIAEIGGIGGHGGVIAIDRAGTVTYAFNTESMRLARANAAGLWEFGIKLAADPSG